MSSFGANIAFIEELYEKYQSDPLSVSASWREFFQDYDPSVEEEDAEEQIEQRVAAVASAAPAPAPRPPVPAAAPALAPAPAAPRPTAVPQPGGTPVALRGAASKIVTNMELSLGVPTATSIRNIPVKVLEENRRVINNHLTLIGQSKASFTHIIAWALVRAIKSYPRMNAAFAMQDGTPMRIDREDVNLGIAIDLERKDGSRSLLVPNIKRANTMDFAQFLKGYNDVVRKARNNTLEVSDFEGTSLSLTNPGTIGTVASVPRLMPNQGTIIATGQIDYSAEYSASRSCRPRRPRHLEGDDDDVDVRPSHHPGRGVRRVSRPRARAAPRRRQLLRRHLSRSAHPLRARALGARIAIACSSAPPTTTRSWRARPRRCR